MKRTLTTIKATTLVTIIALSSTLATAPHASAKGFDIIDSVRQALSGKDSSQKTSVTSSSDKSKLQQIISKGDQEIARRLQSLNKLEGQINAATKLSAASKATLVGEVNTTITGLNTLKVKLDADTNLSDARNDAKAILSDYRVYALVMPKAHLVKLADDILTTSDKLTSLADKLQTRITAAQQAGKDVASPQTKLDDLKSQAAAAQTLATSVETNIMNLQPTDYNNNHKLLDGYNGQLKTARGNNQAAYADARAIAQSLKGL
jgi:hypothetical protein